MDAIVEERDRYLQTRKAARPAMPAPWESPLRRWVDAGLLDAPAAERIRAWERGGRPRARFGGLPGSRSPWAVCCSASGILLFVAAHWDGLTPGQRFVLVLAVVGGLHAAAAVAAERNSGLSAALHACGTAALGGGIFLSGQIFHLQEHWPGGLLLWAIGAWIGWWLLRQWPQALFGAALAPAWLFGEWVTLTERQGGEVGTAFLLLLALAYLGAEPYAGPHPAVRRSLIWLGGLALLPTGLAFVASEGWGIAHGPRPASLTVTGWILAIGVAVGIGYGLRRANLAPLLAASAWVFLGTFLFRAFGAAPYVWAAGFAVGIIAWGLADRRPERINLGIAGFALTVLVFYFSDVMDKLGRSASLIGLGLLFLGGGYLLERTRRRLVAGVREAGS